MLKTNTPVANTTNNPNNSNFNYGSFGKALDAINKQTDRKYTTGFAAFGDSLSGIANAYAVSNGFDFTSSPVNKTTA